MMYGPSDAERSRKFYDELGIVEWDHPTRSPSSRVPFEMHKRMLARSVQPGSRVLEVGAGPGRFTIELARLRARVVVADISPIQLRLNEQMVAQAGIKSSVEARLVLDVVDLSSIASHSCDAVVAFGGPISYAFDRAEEALAGCLRVTRPGGLVLASVMSLIGSVRHHLRGVVEEMSTLRARHNRLNGTQWRAATHLPQMPDVPMERDRRPALLPPVRAGGGRCVECPVVE